MNTLKKPVTSGVALGKSTFQKKEESKDQTVVEGELCMQHQKKLEIICIDDQMRICPNCALFGAHKNHEIKMEQEVMQEIQIRTECLLEMYQLIEQNSEGMADPEQVEILYQKFQAKKLELNQRVKDQFKEIKASLKIKEQQTSEILNRNLDMIGGNLKRIRDVPKQVFNEADKWISETKLKLDRFSQNSTNPNYIAFEMLEDRDKLVPDVLQVGEKILMQIDGQKDVSVPKIEGMIDVLEVKFDNQAIKNVNELCQVESLPPDLKNFQEDDSTSKSSLGRISNTGLLSTKHTKKEQEAKKKEDLLTNMSFSQMEDFSNKKEAKPVQESPFQPPLDMSKQSSQVADATQDIIETGLIEEEEKKDLGSYLDQHEDLIDGVKSLRLSNQEQSQEKIEVEKGEESREEQVSQEQEQVVDEELIEKMENYLKEIIEDNESCIDISDTPIGNYGANCVAAVFNISESLVDIKLTNCEIGNEGALSIFSELKENSTVKELDLSGNPLTEEIFDALVELCGVNKTLQRVLIMHIKAEKDSQKLRADPRIVHI